MSAMNRSRRAGRPRGNRSRRSRPQLQRKYGYFRCKACRKSWESAYTWVIKGTEKVYYRQDCKSCDASLFPYKTEDLLVPSEDEEERKNDTSKNHIQALCHRCRNRSTPCSSSR